MIGLATAGMIGAGIGAGANVLGNIATNVTNSIQAEKTRDFNREEAEKNRQFQKEMAQNNIKYAINQAREMGISPSLILGHETKALGSAQASVSGGQAHFDTTGINSATSGIINALNEYTKQKTNEEMNEDRITAMKEMNRDRLDAIKEMNTERIRAMKNSTTSNEYIKNNYTKEQLNSLFQDLDNVQV